MKHIHIVNPYNSIAMQRHVAPLVAWLPKLYVVSEGKTPNEDADLNFHVPYHTLVNYEGKGLQAMAYTHCNPPDVPNLIDACNRANLITCYSFAGRQELVNLGVDPQKLWVIRMASDNFKYRKRIVGVIGFAQPNGRKRESLLLDLAWKYDLSGYHFLIAGNGWEWVVQRLFSLGVSVQHVELANDEQLTQFYNSMDAFLVTAYAEGGPIPLLEAMATGVPVISPRYGYAADMLDEWQFYDTIDDLMDALDKISKKSVADHQLVRGWSLMDFVSEHGLIFGRLLGESAELFPEQGLNRYSQLFDAIDKYRPERIVEVGTWNGHRAIQMIQQAAKYGPIQEISYQGFDLFEDQTGEHLRRELSKAGWPIEIVKKRINATGALVSLIKGNTTDTLAEYLHDADLFFIDGGHSERTVKHDWEAVSSVAPDDAVIIFDDYYHKGKPDGMGCNVVVDNIDRDLWKVEYLAARTLSNDGREIGMVLVKRKKDASLRLPMQTEAHTRTETDFLGAWETNNMQ